MDSAPEPVKCPRCGEALVAGFRRVGSKGKQIVTYRCRRCKCVIKVSDVVRATS